MQYFLSIETTGLDPGRDRLIAIQYTNMATNHTTILKAWETSEQQIIEQFVNNSGINSNNRWDFIPVGFMLSFADGFLKDKCRQYNMRPINLLDRPHLDMYTTGVLFNGNKFQGSSLKNLVGDKNDKTAKMMYETKDYGSLTQYIQTRTASFLEWFAFLEREISRLNLKWVARDLVKPDDMITV